MLRCLWVLAAVMAGACVDASVDLPPPPDTVPTTATTQPVDYSRATLPKVPGATTTTMLPVQGGQATLQGTVTGPEGPVAGATVHLERLVGDAVAGLDLPTNPDGTWLVPGVRGGRYRIRAFRVPDLAMVAPEVLFISALETRALDLVLEDRHGPAVTASVAPSPPPVDEPANLVVLVTVRSVGNDGVVRSEPVGLVQIQLFGSGNWAVRSDNPVFTDLDGRARWELECRDGGAQPLSVAVSFLEGQQSFGLELPPCADVSPPTTSAPDDDVTTTSVRRTTTTDEE